MIIITSMSNFKEKELFNIFKKNDGFDLYNEVKLYIEEFEREVINKQLDKRSEFARVMMTLWNNAGWDDKKRQSNKLDKIRDEQRKIGDEMTKYKFNDYE